ncbi:hypothetical protein [Qipengyuania marisflavi]|uniref:Lipoprotein n=1 Tax=Qipengyuania marisflavi TaxID=2486356 RepID=A0A5S3P9G0_9SPHN|nr:hypothetical protein [Qipengyuania marisflavi]TMM50152.1 hypothetical protein FEV51_02895 [Qipengyuania marisflavi]
MRNLILAGAAALAFTAAPAIAQDVAVDANGNVYVLTTDQQTMYEGWPAERRVMYDAWPYGVQEYYWTLAPTEVDGWWVLNDEQRVRIFEMTPQQRTVAWSQIATQMGAAPAPASRPATGTMPRFVTGEVAQTTPAAMTPAGGEYPPCKGDQQDNCINPREAGLNYGNRPLNYWPGKPASEIATPLPAKKPGS